MVSEASKTWKEHLGIGETDYGLWAHLRRYSMDSKALRIAWIGHGRRAMGQGHLHSEDNHTWS